MSVNNVFVNDQRKKEKKEKKENMKSSKRVSFKQLLSLASRVDKVSSYHNSSFSHSRLFKQFETSA